MKTSSFTISLGRRRCEDIKCAYVFFFISYFISFPDRHPTPRNNLQRRRSLGLLPTLLPRHRAARRP